MHTEVAPDCLALNPLSDVFAPRSRRGACSGGLAAASVLAALAALQSSSTVFAQSASLANVVIPGAVAPGTTSDVSFRAGVLAGVSPTGGNGAFVATLQGASVTTSNDTGWWQGVSSVTLAARKGGPAPVFPDADYAGFSQLVVGNQPFSLAIAQLSGAGVDSTNDAAVIYAPVGDVSKSIIRRSEAPVGLAGDAIDTIADLRVQSVNAAAPTGAWVSRLVGPSVTPTNNFAIVETDLPGGLFATVRVLFRAGPLSTLPGASATIPTDLRGSEFGYTSDSWVARVKLSGAGITPGNGDDAIIAGATGVFSSFPPVVVARDGAQANDLPAGVNYDLNATVSGIDVFTNGSVAIAPGARVALVTRLTGTGVSSANNFAFYAGPTGQLRLLARKGDPAPGGNGIWSNLDTPFMNTSGQAMCVALLSSTTPVNSRAIALFTPPSGGSGPYTSQIVARSGDPAPGLTGITFVNVFPLALTNAGVVAFTATLAGPGVVAGTNDLGLFFGTQGALLKVARTGESFNSKIIRGIRFDGSSRGNADGRLCGLADNAQLTCTLNFTDSTNAVLRAAASGGACCSGSTCSVVTQANCPAQARFVGPGTVCNVPGNTRVPCCQADFNQSLSVSVQDIFDFLAAWFGGASTADVNGSGAIGVQDIFDFLSAWFTGC